ncbi:MAG: hypothetical protein WKF60_08060 [Ilumatobacter sp.]
MRARVFLVTAITLLIVNPGTTHADVRATGPSSAAVTASAATTTPLDGPPRPPETFNEFLPEERGLGECISSVPRPGCGSEARGGWHQTLVFLAIFAGLGLIGWRIAAGARKAKGAMTTAARTAPSGGRSSTATGHTDPDAPEP